MAVEKQQVKDPNFFFLFCLFTCLFLLTRFEKKGLPLRWVHTHGHFNSQEIQGSGSRRGKREGKGGGKREGEKGKGKKGRGKREGKKFFFLFSIIINGDNGKINKYT